jgi:2,3-bisphosphoglycerate-independent phosphoglycerate mutase
VNREEFFKNLHQTNNNRLLLIVMDGVGGLPVKDGKTELEYAHTPNLDALARRSTLGLSHPIFRGITPGSGPSHLALFGYDPLAYDIGRGVLENLGLGVELGPGDVAIRGNFCTVEYKGGKRSVVDRRAGRIPTEENRRLCALLQERLGEFQGVSVKFTPGMEHRCAIRLRGEGLGAHLNDTDPQQTGVEPLGLQPGDEESKKTAALLTALLEKVGEILKGEERANFLLLRGIAHCPHIPPMEEVFGLKAAAIATYPMYRGLAQLVGMEVLHVDGMGLEDEIAVLEATWERYTFFYLHVKKTDSYGEDGNPDAKISVIEEVDRLIPRIEALHPDVLVITGDHSTPSVLKGHSWHPNPLLLCSPYAIPDGSKEFGERACMRGGLGHLSAMDVLPLMLAHGNKLRKFGA